MEAPMRSVRGRFGGSPLRARDASKPAVRIMRRARAGTSAAAVHRAAV